MLEGYFDETSKSAEEAIKKSQRLLAIQAALEISKAAVSAPTNIAGSKSAYDIDSVTKKVAELADAIQAALQE
jgi:hypothetical protein